MFFKIITSLYASMTIVEKGSYTEMLRSVKRQKAVAMTAFKSNLEPKCYFLR